MYPIDHVSLYFVADVCPPKTWEVRSFVLGQTPTDYLARGVDTILAQVIRSQEVLYQYSCLASEIFLIFGGNLKVFSLGTS